MWCVIQLLVFGLIIALTLQCCSERLDDGSRALSVQVDVNNMGGKGLSISVTRLTVEEPPDSYRKYR